MTRLEDKGKERIARTHTDAFETMLQDRQGIPAGLAVHRRIADALLPAQREEAALLPPARPGTRAISSSSPFHSSFFFFFGAPRATYLLYTPTPLV